MGDILYLGKKSIKDNFYYEVYFFGAVKLAKCTKEKFENCKLLTGAKLSFDDIELSCYNKGYDTIVNLKVK